MVLKIQWKALFLSLLISMGVGGLSAWTTSGSMPLYEELAKPPLSPPGWLFGVVWTILFFLMGISSYIVYTSDSPKKGIALKLYAVQLAVNFFWPILFFNLRLYWPAFFWLILLWILIIGMIARFSKVEQWWGYLQVHYLLRVTFLGDLSFSLALLDCKSA